MIKSSPWLNPLQKDKCLDFYWRIDLRIYLFHTLFKWKIIDLGEGGRPTSKSDLMALNFIKTLHKIYQ